MARIGRPPKDEAAKKGAQLSIRIPAQLRARLDAARQDTETERSLSQEIEFRLRRSFEDREQEVKDRFGGPTTYWLFLIIANQVRILENFTQERWWRDPYTHRQMKILINTMLDCFKPAGRARTPSRFTPIGEPLGQHLADRELANIEATLLDPDPPVAWNWGGMTVTEWRQAAERFKDKLKRSPLAKLYGIERTKK